MSITPTPFGSGGAEDNPDYVTSTSPAAGSEGVAEEIVKLGSIARAIENRVVTDEGGVAVIVSAAALGTSGNPVTSPTAARPQGLSVVYWYTAVQPTNWVAGDVWDSTTSTTGGGVTAAASLGVFNVKDYGAKGDGSDATSAIQTAVAAAAAVPGSVVLFPVGTYSVTSTIGLPDHTTFLGLGTSNDTHTDTGAVLFAANGSNLNAVVADANWLANATPNVNGQRKVIRNMVINGNDVNQTSGLGCGIIGMAYRFECDQVTVYSTRGDGIRLTNVDQAGTVVNNATSIVENRITECQVLDFGSANTAGNRDGIAIRIPSTASVTDGHITGCVVYSTRGAATQFGHGIYMDAATDWVIDRNHTYSTGLDGIHIGTSLSTSSSSGPYARITNNFIEFYGLLASVGQCAGIYVNSEGPTVLLAHNTIHISGAISGNTFYGMFLEGATSRAANFQIGPNTIHSDVTATGIRVKGNGSNGYLGWTPQVFDGSLAAGGAAVIDVTVGMTGTFGGLQQISSAGTVTPDLSIGDTVEITQTGNITLANPVTGTWPWGSEMTLILFGSGAGGWTVTFGTAYKTSYGATTLTTGKYNTLKFKSDGSHLVQIGAIVTGM